MARLIYAMLQSADGYTADEHGRFGGRRRRRGHGSNALASSAERTSRAPVYDAWRLGDGARRRSSRAFGVGAALERGRQVVYSRTLDAQRVAEAERGCVETDAVRALVARRERDVAVSGPELAA